MSAYRDDAKPAKSWVTCEVKHIHRVKILVEHLDDEEAGDLTEEDRERAIEEALKSDDSPDETEVEVLDVREVSE